MPEWWILVPGLAAFVGTYFGAAVSGTKVLGLVFSYPPSSRGGTAWGFVPLVGPWILEGRAHGDAAAQAEFALYGIFQAAGLACIVIGLAIDRHAAPDEPQAWVAPLIAPGAGGLSVAGRF